MSADFDVVIVGSGPAGVSAAHPLVEGGLRVLMVDGGRQSAHPPLDKPYLSARFQDPEQWKWMVGEDFHALKMRDAMSPKLRVPDLGYVFADFLDTNRIVGDGFITTGSLATGGLSNAWGCGVARLSDVELRTFPFAPADIEKSYQTVAQRMGISGGVEDDLSDYFGLDAWAQPPIAMDSLHRHLASRYARSRGKLAGLGFALGRARVAALSENHMGRQACDLSGNCMWGCSRRSLYASGDEVPVLAQHANFSIRRGFIVTGLSRSGDDWVVEGRSDSGQASVTARKVLLAAGTLASTRLALKTLGHDQPVRVLSSPTAAFLLWLPRYLGTPRVSGFGLGQLSYALSLPQGVSGFGSTFATTGLAMSDFVQRLPVSRRYGIEILKTLLTSCLVGNLFLPGRLSDASASLQHDGALVVSGHHREETLPIMAEAARLLRKSYWNLGGFVLPGSFTLGKPGGDIHYAGTLPMRRSPTLGETNAIGEVCGLPGIHMVDGASLPLLTEKSHTLTIMANADRIGRRIAQR